MDISIRPAHAADRDALIQVEAGATPNLSYVGHVFEMFLSDQKGEFSVAEVDGEVVACGKFTVVPDGSAWLETIRVLPAFQGHGIGKRFYERFFEVASEQNVTAMRMYTGIKNVVSKGLAAHFGFQLAETFGSVSLDCSAIDVSDVDTPHFQSVTEPAAATELLLKHADGWNNYLVMNRTFYKLTPALCTALANAGQVYASLDGPDVLVAGARFMPETALHIGHYSGNEAACLNFAIHLAQGEEAKHVSCLFPYGKTEIQQNLTDYGFQLGTGEFIVMERNL